MNRVAFDVPLPETRQLELNKIATARVMEYAVPMPVADAEHIARTAKAPAPILKSFGSVPETLRGPRSQTS